MAAQGQRPTISSFANYLGLDVPAESSDSDDDEDPMVDALYAALDYVEDRIDTTLPAMQGRSLAPGSTTYPRQIRQAVMILGSVLYKRRLSPEGVAGFGDLGVVRMLAHDAHVETLIERLSKVEGFA